MTFAYDKMAATAKRLLVNFGQTVTVTRPSSTIDPVTGAVTGSGGPTFSPVGVLSKYPDGVIDGTRITASDRLLTLDDTVEPKVSDKVTVNGEQWNIMEVMSVNPAGTPLIYNVRVRR